MNAVPLALKRAIGVGIGLFILFIGFANGGLIQSGCAPVVPLPVCAGTLVTCRSRRRRPVRLPVRPRAHRSSCGPARSRPRWSSRSSSRRSSRSSAGVDEHPGERSSLTPSFSTLGAVRPRQRLQRRCRSLTAILVIFAIMLTDFFDTMGTVTGVAAEAGLAREDGIGAGRRPRPARRQRRGGRRRPRRRVVEHHVHRERGGRRRGRAGPASRRSSPASCSCWRSSWRRSPGIIPSVATAPALVLVGYLMFTQVKDINVADIEDGLPALLTMILMPLTYDITVGIGAGFISWVAHQGRPRQDGRGPPADVGGLDRVRRVLPAELAPARPAQVAPTLVADERGRRPRAPAASIPGRPPRSGTIPAMFERTALPDGPRVISARLPAARSVSVAAYVPRRLAPRGAASRPGMAHFLEHLTFKGTAAYPSTRALSEAIEGVGGSFNAATDREATVYWVRVPRRETERAMTVLGELICRPALDPAEIDREREVIVEEIRGYLDDPAEYSPDPVPAGDVRRGRARPRDLRRGGRRPGAAGRRDPRRSGRRPTGRRTPSSRSPATSTHAEAVELVGAHVRARQRRRPRLRAGARAAGRRADPDRPPRHDPGAALRRRAGAAARPPRRLGARRCSTRSSATA